MSDFQKPTGVDWEIPGEYGQVRFGNDKHTLAVFYTRSVLNEVKSVDANRPIHENHTYVRIQPPGERLNIVDRPVKPEDKRRWPVEWNAYVTGRTQIPEGTPIEMLFVNHPAIGDTLKGCNVFTIEQLASLSANAMDTIGMGAQDWVNKAKQYLESSEKGKDYTQLTTRMEQMEGENRVLKHQLQQAIDQIKLLEQRMLDPVRNSLNPPMIHGVDPVVERINANRAASVDFVSPGDLKAAQKQEKMKDPFAIDTGDF
jgi:hypothetical protein